MSHAIAEGTPPAAVEPEVLEAESRKWTPTKIIIWVLIALLGGVAWGVLALSRGESINAVWFVFASVCTYLIAYRFYSKYIERHITRPDDKRATPAEVHDNGQDYMPTDRRVLFGHHFAAIAGAGPLVGPVLAAQMGYLPGTIWIVAGVVLAGAVQDYLVMFFSMRRGGRSLGQMARDELGVIGGTAAIIATLLIMVIITAILALVVVNSLAESAWGVYSVGLTIPIAILMGLYLRFIRPGRVLEVSIIGFVLLMAAIISGRWVAETSWGADFFTLNKTTLAWCIIIYGFIAAILPVWFLLAPRDYLSTFMKIGVIALLAVAILVVHPDLEVPKLGEFAMRDDGPVVAGSLFPFLFVTIACGALSGFHALISSGTTPKLVQKERQTRFLGYGGMLMESFVAIMALVAALSIDRGVYFAMNSGAGATGGTVEGAVQFVNSLGLTGVHLDAGTLNDIADNVGEDSVVSRTGGAPTLAVGISHIMHQWFGGTAMMGFWYHFAIMFEALFILTAVDAGTRVSRFMLQDAIGNFIPKFKDNSWRIGSWIATAIMVAGWGYILVLGVTDPLGGINTFFPLFGISNQLLAAIALSVVMAIVAKRAPRYLWVVILPTVATVIITTVASLYKIFSTVPSVGYFAQNRAYRDALDSGATSFGTSKSVSEMEAVIRNTAVQGTLSVVFLVLTLIVVVAAVLVTIRNVRTHRPDTTEDPEVPSKIYAPAGIIATPSEKALVKEWEDYEAGGSGPTADVARKAGV